MRFSLITFQRSFDDVYRRPGLEVIKLRWAHFYFSLSFQLCITFVKARQRSKVSLSKLNGHVPIVDHNLIWPQILFGLLLWVKGMLIVCLFYPIYWDYSIGAIYINHRLFYTLLNGKNVSCWCIYMLIKLVEVCQLLLYFSWRLEQKHTNTYCFKILLQNYFLSKLDFNLNLMIIKKDEFSLQKVIFLH